MKNKKVIFIFLIVVIAIVVFSILFLNIKNKKLDLNIITKLPKVVLRDDGVARYVGKDEISISVKNKSDVLKVIEEVKGYFKIDENASSVLEISSVQESGDFTYYKLNQKYNNIKVYGNSLIVAVNKDNVVTSITGKYVPISKLSTNAKVNITEMEQQLASILNEEFELLEKEKYIYIKDEKPIYCYVYTVLTAFGKYEVFIDAKEAVEIERISKNVSADYLYTGKDIFGEVQTISINEMDLGGYQLHDNNRNISIINATNIGVETEYDEEGNISNIGEKMLMIAFLNLKQDPTFVTLCKDNTMSIDLCVTKDTNFIRNSISTMSNLSKTYDFYNNVLGRKSYDNNGSEILANVGVVSHLLGNEDYENAYWNETNFVFGSKNNISLGAALDIVAHEYTHAVSGSIANFTYFGESGALDEAYSDILGSLIEGKNFQIGEDFGGYRDMTNPNKYKNPMVKDGKYYFPTDEETYNEEWRKKVFKNPESANWKNYDDGGVHTNSGVPNYAAFLMYDNGAFSSKEEMAKVWYNSLFLLSSNADFEDCALAVIESAKNLGLSNEKIKIIEAAFKTTKMLEDKYGSLSGKVVSMDDKPLQGTVVTVINQLNPHVNYQTTTDKNGEYKFEELITVDYNVVFEMPKYKEYETQISVSNEENNLNVKLELIPESDYNKSEIVFVLDISASMDKSDSTDIRKQIIKNIISSLDNNSKVALIVFNATGKIINNGISDKRVNKKILITDVFNIVNDNGYNTDSGTNGREGLTTALSLFSNDSKTRKYIVFLTDGEDNKYTGLTYDEIIKKSNEINLRILTIGLGDAQQLDQVILTKLANETNGKYYHATKSSNLYEFDKRIFAELN